MAASSWIAWLKARHDRVRGLGSGVLLTVQAAMVADISDLNTKGMIGDFRE